MKPNEQFMFSVEDIDLIENALTAQMIRFNDQKENEKAKQIHELLGQIHNQKIWYRPQKNTYISG